MKKAIFVLIVLAIGMISCTPQRRSGCPTSQTGDPGGKFKG